MKTAPTLLAALIGLASFAPAAPLPDSLVDTLLGPTSYELYEFQGRSVAVDGNLAVVGAPQSGAEEVAAGTAKVYDLGSATPATPIAVLRRSPGTALSFSKFGSAVAISGTRIAVGAPHTTATLSRVFIYDLTSATPDLPILTLSDPVASGSTADFGNALALDGNRLIVSDSLHQIGAGIAYVYDLAGATPTTPSLALTNPNFSGGTGFVRFGFRVSLSGHRAAVMANGSAFVYDLTSATPNEYVFSSINGVNSVALDGGKLVVSRATAASVYDLDGASPANPIAQLNDPNPQVDDNFGQSTGIDGTRVVIGAFDTDAGGERIGAAYVYDLTSGTPGTPIHTLANPFPSDVDQFGFSVAISGARAIVGAPNDSASATGSGRAYAYDFGSATPTTPTVVLDQPTPAAQVNFGQAVAVSGSLVAIGAPRDDTAAPDAGAVYIYDRTSATPNVPTRVLYHPEPLDVHQFGMKVAMSGSWVAVGNGSGNGIDIYDLASATPGTPAVRVSEFHPFGGYYGRSIALDGSLLVVGAYLQGDEGRAYVYDLTSATPSVAVRTIPNPTSGLSESFGEAVAISGTRVVVSARTWDAPGAIDAGRVYVFDLSSATPNTPVAMLTEPTPAFSERFGEVVGISGTRVVVSNGGGVGGIYAYDIASATPSSSVVRLATTGLVFNGPARADSIAMSGSLVALGLPHVNVNPASSVGKVRVYDLAGAVPAAPLFELDNPTPAGNERFGYSVALDGTTLVAGTPYDGSIAASRGAAYVFGVFPPNGNFSAGHTGFTSEFNYVAGPAAAPGDYSVVADPQTFDPTLASFGDHTTGSGQMLVGGGLAATVWENTVPVQPGRWYRFSAWAASTRAGQPATLGLCVNSNAPLGTPLALPSTTGSWVQGAVHWYSGTSTTASFHIRGLNTGDFALDDIEIHPLFAPTGSDATDTKAPSVTISNPTGSTLTGAYTINGTVKENFLLASLTVTVNGATQSLAVNPLASFTANTNIPFSVTGIAPENGPNIIVVEAVDTKGNRKTVSKTLAYVNTTLAGRAGTYSAALLPTGTADNDTTGLVTVMVSTTGAFSGTTLLSGVKVAFSGVLKNDGGARFKPAFGTTFDLFDKTEFDSYLGALALSVTDPSGLSGSLSTQASGGSMLGTFAGQRAPYNRTDTAPAAFLNQSTKGVYSIAFPSKIQTPSMDREDYPQGAGYTSLTLLNNGNIAFAGYLADGTKYTGSTKLRADDTAPLYAPLYKKNGAMVGELTFANAPHTDVSGSNFLWLRPVQPRARYYPAGWPNGVRVDAKGTKWANPGSLDFGQEEADPIAGNAMLRFASGDMVSTLLSHPVSVDPESGKVKLIPSTDTYTLSLSAKTGVFSGSFSQGGTNAFRGILLKKGDNQGGFGYYLSPPPNVYGGTGLSGNVLIEP